jgi:hypothetical protein
MSPMVVFAVATDELQDGPRTKKGEREISTPPSAMERRDGETGGSSAELMSSGSERGRAVDVALSSCSLGTAPLNFRSRFCISTNERTVGRVGDMGGKPSRSSSLGYLIRS